MLWRSLPTSSPLMLSLGVLCFPGDLFYFPSEIELEFCLPTLSHRSMAAPCLKQAIRKQGEEKSHVGLFLSPSQRGKFPFLRVSPPVIFHWPFSYHTQQIAWGLEHEKVEKIIKGKVDFSPFSVLRPPFLTSWTKIRVLFQELFVCTWVPLLGFLLQCVQAGDYSSGGKKKWWTCCWFDVALNSDFPSMPATIYLSVFSGSYYMHPIQVLYLRLVGGKG